MTLKDYYKYSWFSNMAYVLWDETNTVNVSAMMGAANSQQRVPGNPNSLATTLGQDIFITQAWSVTSFQPNDSTGFAANVFSKAGTNEKVLAIRGTEAGPGYPIQTLEDLVTADIGEIGLMGLALEQAVSLFNYIQQLRADATNTEVLRLGLNVITLPGLLPSPVPAGAQSISVDFAGTITYIWFDVYHDAQGLGILNESDQVTVAGHSLGGHLAALAARLFPDLFDQSVVFNAAGFDPLTSLKLTDEVVGLFGSVLSADGQTTPALSFTDILINNLQAEDSAPGDDTNLVASLLTGIPAGLVQDIRVENNSHSMDQLMDSLGVLSLLEELNPLMPENQIFTLYDALSNQSGATDETLLEKLSRFFLFNDTELEIVEAGLISHGDFSIRSANHERLLQIQAAIMDQGYVLESIVGQTAAQLIVNASNSLAYGYALKELNPFVITGTDALYVAHNVNHALELYDPASNPDGQLTMQYLEDRAKFLVNLTTMNLGDNDSEDVLRGVFDKYYEDVDQDIKLLPASFDPILTERVVFGSDKADVPDTLMGSNRDDHLYGQNGDDTLAGGDGMDYLDGGEGNDSLNGLDSNLSTILGGAQDILNGGKGFDTYLPGLGDVIQDSDGQGIIFENEQIINLSNITLSATGSDVFTNNDQTQPIRFKLLSDNTLQVIGSYFTIQDFTNGDLGITLDSNASIPALNYITGTDLDDRLGIAGGIGGTENADEMHGLLGDDEMDGMEGDDVLFGEAGDDLLIGNFGHDVLDGGDGRDALLSGIGRDVLLGGAGDDFLSGFDQEDYLEGGDGNDFLAGGTETDTLLGGDGEDVLIGDGMYFVSDRTWQVTVTDTTPGVPGGKVISFSGPVSGAEETQTTGDVADYLDGGAGDDVLVGGGGNDQLYGGEDDDDLEGGAGDDYLNGGAGNDGLWGDSSSDPAAIGNDRLEGGTGDDYLVGGAGDDVLYGGDDMDNLSGGEGNDELHGGAGNDVVHGGSGLDVIDGGTGADQLFGDEDDDRLFGNTGMDTLAGGDGNDFLSGGEDNDLIAGQSGNDELHGDAGDDQIQGNEGNDLVSGEDGNDLLFGQEGNDQLVGGAGNDQLIGDAGNDILDGGEGDDILWGMDGNDILAGGSGNDLIYGNNDIDMLSGDDGDDELWGGSEDDMLSGGAGRDLLFGEAGNDMLDGGDGDDQLVGDAGNDSLNGGSGTDTLFGGTGIDNLSGGDDNDEIQGGDDDDLINGGAGDDLLFGDNGNDTLVGGTGNDTLYGDPGSDLYLYARGDGQDVINNHDPNTAGTGPATGKIDVLRFGPGIHPDEISAIHDPGSFNNLVLKVNGSSDQMTILNYFANSGNSAWRLDRIEFADGTVWTPETIPLLIQGTSGNDTLVGTSRAEVFDGGAGNDSLQGGAGNDTYRFGVGYGQDTVTDSDSTAGNVDRIYVLDDVLPADVTLSRSGNNLLLRINDTTDRLTLVNYFVNDGVSANTVEQIKFAADGTVWEVNLVKQLVLTATDGNDTLIGYTTNDVLNGLGGNDTLIGNAGNDILNGGAGNDTMQGGGGDDTYLFGRDYGQDTITDVDTNPGNSDTVLLAGDVLPADVTLQRNGGGLVLRVNGTSDQLTINSYFVNDGASPNLVEHIQFLSDGAVWDINTVKLKVLTGTESNDTLIGYASDDVISGLEGDDSLYGSAGNDSLVGGDGDDTIYGQDGNDILDGRGALFPAAQNDGDFMVGGTGDDLYLFGRYSSTDRIWDNYGATTSGGFDTIVLDADIMPEDVTVKRGGTGTTLLLYLNNAPVQLWVDEYFKNDGYNQNSIEQILFSSNGTVWDIETIKAKVLIPTEGSDLLFGYSTNDVINSLGGNDGIRGGEGDDILDGGPGNDGLFGEGGNDTYLFSRGWGQDTIVNYEFDTPGSIDTLKFAPDILPSQITVSRDSSYLVLTITGTSDEVRIRDYFFGNQAVVERLEFADGTVWTEDTIAAMFPLNGTAGNDTLQGFALSEYINGLGGDDVLRGGDGNDTMDGGTGVDLILGEGGNDILYAGYLDGVSDRLYGGIGNDVLVSSGDKNPEYLYGESGNDIYLGGAGRDWMEDISGSNLLYGGDNIDDMWGGNNNDLYIGGGATDFIDGDRDNNGITGQDILFFNRGDKSDSINRLGQATAASLGGGILYSQLKLERDGTALVLKLGHNEEIYFNDWYGSEQTSSQVKYLQIVIEGTRNYNPASSSPWENQKVVVFDFEALVAAFDAAQAAGQRFNVGSSLSQYFLWGSDTKAYGGMLAYEYATNGNLDNITITDMQNILGDPVFGIAPQGLIAGTQAFAASVISGTEPGSTSYLQYADSLSPGGQTFTGIRMNLWQGTNAANYDPGRGTYNAGLGNILINQAVDHLVQSMAGFNIDTAYELSIPTQMEPDYAGPEVAAAVQQAA